MTTRTRTLLGTLLTVVAVATASAVEAGELWSREAANAWYRGRPTPVGCNFAPSTAINQLEMWQADTFDLATIDRELGWAEDLGFNSVRVFLHHLLWEQDRQGFLQRIETVPGRGRQAQDRRDVRAVRRRLGPVPASRQAARPAAGPAQLGLGAEPRRGDPQGPRPARRARRSTSRASSATSAADQRIHAWDLFNEPDNTNGSSYGRHEPPNKAELALALLKKVFAWAREADPTQPLTSGVWTGDVDRGQALADEPVPARAVRRDQLPQLQNRCRSSRTRVATLQPVRPAAPLHRVHGPARRAARSTRSSATCTIRRSAAYNWGFVAGKTQTIYPWDSWQKPYAAEPPVWFHDIFRADGTPYNPQEVEYIKRVTGKRRP